MALEDHRALAVERLGLGGQVAEGDVAAARDVARRALVVLAHVDDLGAAVGQRVRRVLGAHLELRCVGIGHAPHASVARMWTQLGR